MQSLGRKKLENKEVVERVGEKDAPNVGNLRE
jgi:hypothetical protein